MQRKLRLPIGSTNYKEVCTHYYYLDKTLLIKDILDDGAKILLLTRPRRFGKTLNMDMLRTFFEKTGEDTSSYFKNKKIWQQGEAYTKEQGKYPVIYLSLKDIKSSEWKTAFGLLKLVIASEFSRHRELDDSTKIAEEDSSFYKKIVNGTAAKEDYMLSLRRLSQMLQAYYELPVVIIIDEYDTPIQEGYVNGYYAQSVEFIRNFFSAALKDNPYVKLSVMTGILRVAKESIFSGLNNVRVYSVLDKRFSSYFGFTSAEVQTMAEYYEAEAKLPEIKQWYDGYKFGEVEIYNPWSVINYFANDCEAEPYWVQTSANLTIREIIKNLDESACEQLRELLNGATVQSVVETDIIYPSLRDTTTNIFGFLLLTGYLKAVKTMKLEGMNICELAIPNKEVKTVYRREILSLLQESRSGDTINKLQLYLITKNSKQLQAALRKFLLEAVSFYDGLQENYYQGLLLGMTGMFTNDYYPLSNRESGEGRFDIQLTPKTQGMPGIIIEIKAAKEASAEQLKKLAEQALEQIEVKHYDTELRRQGIGTIYKYGIAFCGKKVEIATK